VKGHRQRRSSIWPTRFIAVLAALLLMLPNAASLACVQFSAGELATPSEAAANASDARSLDCCDHERRPPPDDERHENCPCPFPCAPGCGGPPRAIVSPPLLPDAIPNLAPVVFTAHRQRAPQSPEPLGIAHVPKLVLS